MLGPREAFDMVSLGLSTSPFFVLLFVLMCNCEYIKTIINLLFWYMDQYTSMNRNNSRSRERYNKWSGIPHWDVGKRKQNANTHQTFSFNFSVDIFYFYLPEKVMLDWDKCVTDVLVKPCLYSKICIKSISCKIR